MRYATIGGLIALLFLFGCASRKEAAKSAKQADQAITRVQHEISSQLDGWQDRVGKLLNSARQNLQPVVMNLSDGAIVNVDTTEDEPVDQFVTKAIKQAGRSEAEVEHNAIMSAYIDAGSSSLYGVMSALLGTGTFGLVAAKVLQIIGQGRQALKDQVEYTRDVKKTVMDSVPDEDKKVVEQKIEAVKEQHIKRQVSNGTHKRIREVLKA